MRIGKILLIVVTSMIFSELWASGSTNPDNGPKIDSPITNKVCPQTILSPGKGLDASDINLRCVAEASDPHTGEIIYWVASVILVLVALSAALYAKKQVDEIRASNEAFKLQTRAGLLVELDKQWSAPGLVTIQDDLWTWKKRVRDEAHSCSKDLSEEDLYAEQAKKLKAEDHNKYLKFMRLIDFLETLGYVTRQGYLDEKDIINVFGGIILGVGGAFYSHLRQLQTLPGTSGHAWEHSIWLIDQVRDVISGKKQLN